MREDEIKQNKTKTNNAFRTFQIFECLLLGIKSISISCSLTFSGISAALWNKALDTVNPGYSAAYILKDFTAWPGYTI